MIRVIDLIFSLFLILLGTHLVLQNYYLILPIGRIDIPNILALGLGLLMIIKGALTAKICAATPHKKLLKIDGQALIMGIMLIVWGVIIFEDGGFQKYRYYLPVGGKRNVAGIVFVFAGLYSILLSVRCWKNRIKGY